MTRVLSRRSESCAFWAAAAGLAMASTFRPAHASAQVPLLPVHHVQGTGARSPFEGQVVTTAGVVTARRSNGFFIQTPAGSDDGNGLTSEGLLVFTGTAPAASVVVGALVTVTGRVIEFVPAADPGSPPLTEIGENPRIDVRGFGASLPDPIAITAALASPGSRHDALEPLEGMRVDVASLTVVSPTQGSIAEATGATSSNGVFYGVVTGVPRPFREAGVDVRSGGPPGAPCCLPVFDTNPERLRIDSDAQPGAASLDVPTGAVLANVVGPLDYAFRAYTILPDASTPPQVVSMPGDLSPPRMPAPSEVTVASLNVQRLFDTSDAPGVGDVVLSPTTFRTRIARLARFARTRFHTPDILAVQEVENLETLQALAAAINEDAVANGERHPRYEAFLEQGNDPGGINVGALVQRARVEVLDVRQEGVAARYLNPTTRREEVLNDRPPLVITARAPGHLGRRPILTVMVNHLRSLTDIESPSDGARVRAKRAAQAEFVAQLVQRRQRDDPFARLLVIGDFNAFNVSDGLVDVVGTIRGEPAPADAVAFPTPDLVAPDLVNLIDRLPPKERYSYVFDGTAQALDHALASVPLAAEVSGFAYVRGNADAPEVWRSDARRLSRLSDHDGVLVYLRLGSR